MGVISGIAGSRGFRVAGWAYVVYWILSSGLLALALVFEALLLRRAQTFGTDVAAYVIMMIGFPVMWPGMTVTEQVSGDLGWHDLTFWGVTIATLAWATAGWWTLGAAVWRRLRRRATP